MSGSIRYPGIIYASNNGSQIGELVGLEYIDTGSATFGQMGNACWSVEVHGNDGSGGISPYRERYLLPFVTVGRTNNANYKILTTKETATTGTITPASGRTLSSSSYLKKWGEHFVEFYVELTGGAYSTNGWNTVATFPTGFRPSAAFDFIGLDNGASTQSNLGLDCKMTSSGLLQVYKSASMTPTNNIRIHGTFII